ncbi:MAG: serine/threonine-protein kinase [Myxococcales bacterium]|nr:serine/threonine-protein kinase [Myxococcales bacterium]
MSDDTHSKPLRALNVDLERQRETLTGAREEELSGDEDTIRPTSPAALLAKLNGGDPVIGTQVSGYVVKGRLGSGGMGIVYEGEQPIIGKRVAIKVLRPEVAENPDVVQRLVAEARAVNQVGHRGIIDVFGFGELPDGRQCIVMEYLDGESLEHIINTLRAEHRLMPLAEALGILDEMLSALAAAHSAGVIHRDLKPSNIFLCQQRDGTRYVKVLDFGIAKLGVIGATPQTNASLMVGTPAYMAPEQARGGMVSAALDLYAVGCIAFELITGQQLFQAGSVVEMIMKHQEEKPTRPSEKVLSLPDVVDEFILKLLEKKPENRYQTADEARKVIAPVRKELTKSSARMPELSQKIALSPSMQLEAVGSTAVTPIKRPVNLPQQRDPTEETPELARSKAPLFVVLGVLALVGVGAAFAFSGGSEVATVVPAVVIPTIVDVKPEPAVQPVVPSLEPVPEPKVEPPVVKVEPPPVVKVEPPPAVVEPVAAPVEPPAPKVEAVKPVKPVAVPKLTRGERLLKRLAKIEKLVPPESTTDVKMLASIRAGLGSASEQQLDEIQSALDSIENKYKE